MATVIVQSLPGSAEYGTAGALSFDVTQATSQLPHQRSQTGYSYRINYSKRFDTTGSQLTLASYRYSDPQFLSYARYLDYDDGDRQSEKQTLSVTASQYISALSLNLYVNMLRQTWWNDSPSTTGSITAGYNFDMGRWKNLGVTLSRSKTHYDEEDESDDTQFYLSLSVPLDPDHRLNYDLRNSDTLSHNVSWYDTSDRNNTGRFRRRGEREARFRRAGQRELSALFYVRRSQSLRQL